MMGQAKQRVIGVLPYLRHLEDSCVCEKPHEACKRTPAALENLGGRRPQSPVITMIMPGIRKIARSGYAYHRPSSMLAPNFQVGKSQVIDLEQSTEQSRGFCLNV